MSILLAIVVLSTAPVTANDPVADHAASLHALGEIAEIRASRPETLSCPSVPVGLLGLSSQEIRSVLGKPDWKWRYRQTERGGYRAWTYVLTRKTRGPRAPDSYAELSFTFNADSRVFSATCSPQRGLDEAADHLLGSTQSRMLGIWS